jgi:hypothetical protein
VQAHTAPEINEEIRERTEANIKLHSQCGPEAIHRRLRELDREWDIERTLEANAASLSLAGLALGTFTSKRWYALPAVVAGFLLQHAVQGWCPPLPVFRRMGIRTKEEIEYERHALLRILEQEHGERPDSTVLDRGLEASHEHAH